MDSETIYEALGEVIPVNQKNKSKVSVSIDEGFGALEEEGVSPLQPIFNHEMTDEAVVECIFNCCDVERTGLVRASTLVNFLLKYASENSEIRDIFQDLLVFLDPTDTNSEVTIEVFQSALKFCVTKLTSKTEESQWLFDLSSIKSPPAPNSISSIGSDSRCSSANSEQLCTLMDLKELQFQFNKLQEENQLLQEQMADVEETNVSLRSENSLLKSKINRVESSVSEIDRQSKQLQEDNGFLHGRVTQMKEDLQKMTLHYEECRKELEVKVHELETLQANRAKREEHCDHLLETIKQLEDIILIKEVELEAKDKEIQRIAQDLMEQQLLLDPAGSIESERKGHEVGDSIAAELQSSLGGSPWRKQMESVMKPDFIHPAAWNLMLNEPEYEEQPSTRTHSPYGNFGNTTCIVEKEAETSDNTKTAQAFEALDRNLVHSTPISKTAPGYIDWDKENPQNKKSNFFDLMSLIRHSVRFLLIVTVLLAILAVVSVVVLLLLISLSTVTSCGGVSSYHQQASPYYSSSLWSKVFEIIKPYCSVEYHGCPPV